MEINTFLADYREAFGESAQLPIAFWYANEAAGATGKSNGCMFRLLPEMHAGEAISFSQETLTCGGGKFYCGFTAMPERVPGFVSLTERYKRTPEDVIEFIERLQVPRTDKTYLNFLRIDKLESLEGVEGLLFVATPDVLSGLVSWTCFDNNDDGAVSSLFGSGCGLIVTHAALENRHNGRRTFLGGFDPSVRPWFGTNELSFTIPMSRFREMLLTMRNSALFGTHAWGKVRERL